MKLQLACLLIALSSALSPAYAQPGGPAAVEGVGITDRAGQLVDLEHLSFRDEGGKVVPLGVFFRRGKPVLLNLVYYECPNLCTFSLNGLVSSLKGLAWNPGQQFEVITVSI